RDLPSPVGFAGLPADLGAADSRTVAGGLLERAADGSLVWTASFTSGGAGAVRLYLPGARLPAGSRVYVYGGAGQIHGPYDVSSGTRPEGFWTNTVFAETISIEVRIPAGTPVDELAKAALRIGALVHIEHPSFAPSPRAGAAVRPKSDACFVDRSCV